MIRCVVSGMNHHEGYNYQLHLMPLANLRSDTHGRRLCEARECSAPPEIVHARPAYAWAPPEISRQDVLLRYFSLLGLLISKKIIPSLI